MYPAQTSLIPVTVAITRFVETNGLPAFFGNYPHWYLGVPARFLAGPVTPFLFIGLHRMLTNVSLFTIAIYLMVLSFLLSAVGWAILVRKISGERTIGIIAGLLLLILPWRYLSSLSLDEGSHVLARNLLPYALITTWDFLKRKNLRTILLAILSVSFLLLINTSILSALIVGVSALILTISFQKGKLKKVSKYIKPSLLLIVASLLLVTFWYSPSYWWTILANPSIGGASGVKVILRIFDLLRAAAPLVLAIIAVYFSGKIKSRLAVFSLTWTFTFLFLSLFRFIGDPDFWMDWTSWFFELEIGMALLIAILVTRKRYFESVVVFLIPVILVFYVYQLLGRPALITPTIPKGVSSLERLAEIAGEERVFLSGSTVFWANALYDIYQVRGGRDQVATHSFWNKAAYELREGKSPEKARRWLSEFDVSYVLVHGPKSAEYYHDFSNIQKWDKIGQKVWEAHGDAIYEVK